MVSKIIQTQKGKYCMFYLIVEDKMKKKEERKSKTSINFVENTVFHQSLS